MKLKSFLDGIVFDGRCLLECHDRNHNGDYGFSCGNPQCWKYRPGFSPAPHPIRPPMCRCPNGTFPTDRR